MQTKKVQYIDLENDIMQKVWTNSKEEIFNDEYEERSNFGGRDK